MSHIHIKIWNSIPFNTGLSKYPDLEPWDPNMSFYDAMACIFDYSKRMNNMIAQNNVARMFQIPQGHISDKYDDEPYIVPFVVKGSKDAVLLVPGGAYYDVSLDGEGYPSAEILNKMGVTCFVLKYRVYPYIYPAAQLDCRRALCYLKAHAEEYGFDKDRLSLIGFSAGGNLVTSTTYLFKNMPNIDGYIPDEIDSIDPTPATLAPVYAEVLGDKFLTTMQFGKRMLEDEIYCKNALNLMNLPKYIDKNSPPMFLMNCVDDNVVNPLNTLELARACQANGVSYELHMFNEGGHGFGMKPDDIPPMYGNPGFNLSGTRKWPELYVTWIKKVLDRR